MSVVIKKRTIEHENSVSQRSLHSLTVLIDFDNRRDLTYLYVTYLHDTFVKLSRSDPLKRSRGSSVLLQRSFDRVLEASLRAYEPTRSFAASVLVASLQGQRRTRSFTEIVFKASQRPYWKLEALSMISVKVQVRSITLEVKHTLLEFIWYGESSTYVRMQY